MENEINNLKIYMDYVIFSLGVKYLPSYYDTISQGYMWDSYIYKDKNNISNCPKLETKYLSYNTFISTFEEFTTGKTNRCRYGIEGIHYIEIWKKELYRIKNNHKFLWN